MNALKRESGKICGVPSAVENLRCEIGCMFTRIPTSENTCVRNVMMRYSLMFDD